MTSEPHETCAAELPLDQLALRLHAHVRALEQSFPGCWRRLADIRDHPLAGMAWPEWCWLPMAASRSVVADASGTPDCPHDNPAVAVMSALAPWRLGKGIYRIDETMRGALLSSPLGDTLPPGLLLRLPEWAVYVRGFRDRYPVVEHGFFAHLEFDGRNGRPELRLLFCRGEASRLRRGAPSEVPASRPQPNASLDACRDAAPALPRDRRRSACEASRDAMLYGTLSRKEDIVTDHRGGDEQLTLTVPWEVLALLVREVLPRREVDRPERYELLDDDGPPDWEAFASGALLDGVGEDAAAVLCAVERSLGCSAVVVWADDEEDPAVLTTRSPFAAARSYDLRLVTGRVTFRFAPPPREFVGLWGEARRIDTVDMLYGYVLLGDELPSDDVLGRLAGGTVLYTSSAVDALVASAREQATGAATLVLWCDDPEPHPVVATSRRLPESKRAAVPDPARVPLVMPVISPQLHAAWIAAGFTSVDPVPYDDYLAALQALIEQIRADEPDIRDVHLVMVEREPYEAWCAAKRRDLDSEASRILYAGVNDRESGVRWNGKVADWLLHRELVEHVGDATPARPPDEGGPRRRRAPG